MDHQGMQSNQGIGQAWRPNLLSFHTYRSAETAATWNSLRTSAGEELADQLAILLATSQRSHHKGGTVDLWAMGAAHDNPIPT